MNKIQVRIKWKNIKFESWDKSPVVFTTKPLSEETEKSFIKNLIFWVNCDEVLEIRWNYVYPENPRDLGNGKYIHNDEYLKIQEV